MKEQQREICLEDELRISYNLIITGFGKLQEIGRSKDVYHLPQLLIASGLERFMKCYICLSHKAYSKKKKYPKNDFLRFDLGHDLKKSLEEILNNYFHHNNLPDIREDEKFLREFIADDKQNSKLLWILSEFGKKARYYNLDIVTDVESPSKIDPKEEWKQLEKRIINSSPYKIKNNSDSYERDYYRKVNGIIIAKIERFIRAIARQFYQSSHKSKLKMYGDIFADFRIKHDHELGTIDYRFINKNNRQEKEVKWIKRTETEIVHSGWPIKKITKADFEGDWPFRSDQAIVELRENLFCIINIEGYDFAFNGMASSKYNLPYPYDTFIYIYGTPLTPIIDIALGLKMN